MGKLGMTRSLERENLEVHVELCSQRYSSLAGKLETIDKRLSRTEKSLEDLKDLIVATRTDRNTQLINWGVAIIGTLICVVGFLVWHQIT